MSENSGEGYVPPPEAISSPAELTAESGLYKLLGQFQQENPNARKALFDLFGPYLQTIDEDPSLDAMARKEVRQQLLAGDTEVIYKLTGSYQQALRTRYMNDTGEKRKQIMQETEKNRPMNGLLMAFLRMKFNQEGVSNKHLSSIMSQDWRTFFAHREADRIIQRQNEKHDRGKVIPFPEKDQGTPPPAAPSALPLPDRRAA